MRTIFFGSSRFSVAPLRALRESLSYVVTKKAKPKGRGYLLSDNEVKEEALRLGLPLFEITSFKDETAPQIAELKPDLLVVASFGLIIPRWFLDAPSVGAVNVHPSLLPRYRGPAPIQWAIWNGEKETGITFITMSERMDAGNIIYQERVAVDPDEDAHGLSERLSLRVAELLPNTVKQIELRGLEEGRVQKEEEATYTPMITKEMGKIDWESGGAEIDRQVKALVEWPTAYTTLDGKLLKIFETRVDGPGGEDTDGGLIVDAGTEGIRVSTSNGLVTLKEVQFEGRKKMSGHQFSVGYRGLVGKKFV
jgi:methionyl-tRNA formyltransferase